MDKQSHIQTTLDLEFIAVEKLILNLLKNQEFEFKGQEIKVEKIKINGYGNKLNIKALLSGAFDGKMDLVGKPIFDREQQVIQLTQVNIDLEGSNFLSKTIVVFLGSYIEQKITPFLQFSLKNQINPLNQLLNYIPLKYGLLANAKITDLDIPDIQVMNDKLILHLSLKGNLNLSLK